MVRHLFDPVTEVYLYQDEIGQKLSDGIESLFKMALSFGVPSREITLHIIEDASHFAAIHRLSNPPARR